MISPEGIFHQLDGAVTPEIEKAFDAFITRNRAEKWLLSADFVTDDKNRFNDVFVFTLYPHRLWVPDFLKEIRAAIPRDIKKERNIGDYALAYMRHSQHFSFCIIPNKERKWAKDKEHAKQIILDTIAVMERWVNTKENIESISRMKALYQASLSNSFKLKLMGNKVFVAACAGFIIYLLIKKCNPHTVGWFADRDNMFSVNPNVSVDMIMANYSSLCENKGIGVGRTRIVVATPDSSDKGGWYDELVRIPDYLAGTLAAWDVARNKVITEHPKYMQMIEGVIADNPNVVIYKMQFDDEGIGTSRLLISKNPIDASEYSVKASGQL